MTIGQELIHERVVGKGQLVQLDLAASEDDPKMRQTSRWHADTTIKNILGSSDFIAEQHLRRVKKFLNLALLFHPLVMVIVERNLHKSVKWATLYTPNNK